MNTRELFRRSNRSWLLQSWTLLLFCVIMIPLVLVLMILLIPPLRSFSQQPSYAGQHTRAIKALPLSTIESYLAGYGMGLAKAAELNHYPGPKHVLELAQALHLTEAQRRQTQTLFDAMQKEAIQLGYQLILAERHLDHLFVSARLASGRRGTRARSHRRKLPRNTR